MIRTVVGFLWLDIPFTDKAYASYLVQVALINNLAHSFHIQFQNPFHQIEKSDIVGIQDDQCDILWKCITWINKGYLFAIRKQSIEAFFSIYTFTITTFNGFVAKLVLVPSNSFSKNHILNSASDVFITGILSHV
jgi:hypothetical protein